jgi:pilus assembly protein CpaB
VTVEVKPEEAQRLALAQEAGTLSLTLRNLATTEKTDLRSLGVNELTASPSTSKKGAAPSVTIIRGGERSTETVRGG